MKKIISIILSIMFVLSTGAYAVVAEDEVVYSDMEVDKDSIVYDSCVMDRNGRYYTVYYKADDGTFMRFDVVTTRTLHNIDHLKKMVNESNIMDYAGKDKDVFKEKCLVCDKENYIEFFVDCNHGYGTIDEWEKLDVFGEEPNVTYDITISEVEGGTPCDYMLDNKCNICGRNWTNHYTNPHDIVVTEDRIYCDKCNNEYIHGDADLSGKINLRDTILIMKHCANWSNLNINLTTADANKDGVINLVDVVYLLKYIAAWHENNY